VRYPTPCLIPFTDPPNTLSFACVLVAMLMPRHRIAPDSTLALSPLSRHAVAGD
jgi:hypothetical protein